MIPILLDSSTLQPKSMISGYSSLIWNERFSTPDEFKLVTTDVEQIKNLLPLDSLVSLQDTQRFMIVESHEIAKNSEGGYELTVGGYGFEGFYKHRVITKRYLLTREWSIDNTPEMVVHKLLSQNVGPNALEEFQRVPQYIPGVNGTGMSSIKRVVGEGELESVVNDILVSYNLGMRSIRPLPNQTIEQIFTVLVHQGDDRTQKVGADNPIILDATSGDLVDDSYIDTTADHKNFVYQLQLDGLLGSASDATYPSYYEAGIGTKIAYDSIDWDEWSDEKLSRRREIYQRKSRQTLFQGTARLPKGIEYGSDLNIGDLVTVKGPFGFFDNMRLTEYTRIEDAEGERAYPTLSKDKEIVE